MLTTMSSKRLTKVNDLMNLQMLKNLEMKCEEGNKIKPGEIRNGGIYSST